MEFGRSLSGRDRWRPASASYSSQPSPASPVFSWVSVAVSKVDLISARLTGLVALAFGQLAPCVLPLYACVVALTRRLPLALLATFSIGCGAAPSAEPAGPAPAGPAIKPGPAAVVRERVAQALGADGARCEVEEQAVVCDAGNPARATLVVVYAENPPRLAMVLPFRLQRACMGAMPSLNAFNRDYDYVTLTCEDDGALHATGVMVLPHDGVPPAELAQYAGWWRDTTVATLRATRIAELLR